jgi:hypothetical protein
VTLSVCLTGSFFARALSGGGQDADRREAIPLKPYATKPAARITCRSCGEPMQFLCGECGCCEECCDCDEWEDERDNDSDLFDYPKPV